MPGAFLRDLSPCRGPDYPGDPGAGVIIGESMLQSILELL